LEHTSNTTQSPGIGILATASIGIGGMVGGGIFAVLGTAVSLARGGTPVAFLLAGIVAALTGYCYSKLSVRYPASGGTVVFIDRAFGVDIWTGAGNLVLYLSYLVTISLYACAFGAYAATFFGVENPLWNHGLISIAILLPMMLNLLSAQWVSRLETWIVVFKLVLLIIVVAAGFGSVDARAFSLDQWASPGILVAGGMVIFVAYEGFELIANAGEDVRDPATTLPRAYLLAIGSVIALYLLVAVVTVGSLTVDQIAKSKDYALAAAARPSMGQAGFVLVSVSALMATLSAINATIYGNARLGYMLAKDGELPDFLERKTWSRPVAGVMATSIASLLLANTIDLDSIAMMASGGFLLIFTIVNLACLRLAKEVHANRIICGIAAFLCAAALVTLVSHALQTAPVAVACMAVMVAGAVGFELIYPRIVGRPLRIDTQTQ